MTLEDIIAEDFHSLDLLKSVNLTIGEESEEGIDAVGRALSLRDVRASGGKFKVGDRVFRMSKDGVEIVPDLGGIVTEGEQSWTILAVTDFSRAGQWDLICRNFETLTTVTLQAATYTKDVHGIESATWADDATDVKATIQSVGGMEDEEQELLSVRPTFEIYFLETHLVNLNHRIKGPDDKIYRVKGYKEVDSISDPYTVIAEEW